MAEAEDVITDAAMHAASYVQAVRARRRAQGVRLPLALTDVSTRLDLLLNAAFGQTFRLRAAQPPLPRSVLERLFRRGQAPPARSAVPATDGRDIWLPPSFPALSDDQAVERYRVLALLQAIRARRGAAAAAHAAGNGLTGAVYRVLEAWASDQALARQLPGVTPALAALRAQMLAARPDTARLHPGVVWIEHAVRDALRGVPPVGLAGDANGLDCTTLLAFARWSVQRAPLAARDCTGQLLSPDLWLGDFATPAHASEEALYTGHAAAPCDTPPRSARLPRSPVRRAPQEGEDDQPAPGAFIVQTAQPHEKAEDPLGLQRPSDRDNDTAADEFSDALSELPEARLVRAPGTPAEVLLADDPVGGAAPHSINGALAGQATLFRYPEWDAGHADYLVPGTTVHVTRAAEGDPDYATAMREKHGVLLGHVRRRFELLRARRQRWRRQLDGDEIDLDAWVDARAAHLAGGPPDPRVMQSTRMTHRDLAVLVLVDISGSTDSWISGAARVIDIEREALYLVSHALDALGEPFAIQAFSGEGAHGVRLRQVKDFDERLSERVSSRIAALEPEHFTRAGSAIRHATACLAAQRARHRLLLLLTDGKPNDADHYEGRYGLEDMRRAVLEAGPVGVAPFCMTIDRQAAAYLPDVFGRHQFAILPRTELLPAALLTWLRRLIE